jgi:drug/metabolite transporter (DMT)-like permease
MPSSSSTTERVTVIAAFAAVYLLWGSTYVAIRFAVESIPPLVLAGLRSMVAGVLLFGFATWRGARPPSAREWPTAFLVGGLMFLVCHGSLFWAIQRVPSGIAALLFATMPIWMTIAHIITQGMSDLGPRVAAGLVGGTAGVAILVSPGLMAGSQAVDLVGAVVVVLASIAWTAGSAVARQTPSASIVMSTASYLIGGGVLLFVVSGLTGELARFSFPAVPGRSLWALAYLIVCGSLIGFGAYNVLLRRRTLVAVSSYAYVHPMVAILVGWLLADETLDLRVALAAALIISAVVLLMTASRPSSKAGA